MADNNHKKLNIFYISLHQKDTFGLVVHKTKSNQKCPKVNHSGSKRKVSTSTKSTSIRLALTFGCNKYVVVLLAIIQLRVRFYFYFWYFWHFWYLLLVTASILWYFWPLSRYDVVFFTFGTFGTFGTYFW